jgi:hypothetical protein
MAPFRDGRVNCVVAQATDFDVFRRYQVSYFVHLGGEIQETGDRAFLDFAWIDTPRLEQLVANGGVRLWPVQPVERSGEFSEERELDNGHLADREECQPSEESPRDGGCGFQSQESHIMGPKRYGYLSTTDEDDLALDVEDDEEDELLPLPVVERASVSQCSSGRKFLSSSSDASDDGDSVEEMAQVVMIAAEPLYIDHPDFDISPETFA